MSILEFIYKLINLTINLHRLSILFEIYLTMQMLISGKYYILNNGSYLRVVVILSLNNIAISINNSNQTNYSHTVHTPQWPALYTNNIGNDIAFR